MGSDEFARTHLMTQAYTQAAHIKPIITARSTEALAKSKLKMPPATKIDIKTVAFDDDSASRGSRTCKDDKSKILVEFKDIEKKNMSMLTLLSTRIEDFIALLQVKPKPSTYRVLTCRGFVVTETPQLTRHGMIFEYPDTLDQCTTAGYGSLYSLLLSKTSN